MLQAGEVVVCQLYAVAADAAVKSPAMNLYKKLGFKVVGGYTISYFKTDNFLSI